MSRRITRPTSNRSAEHPPSREVRDALRRRRAEPPGTSPLPASGRTTRPDPVRDGSGRQSGPSGRAAPTVPARRAHRATCVHKWCYCYNIDHLVHPGPCRRCVIDAFNRRDKK